MVTLGSEVSRLQEEVNSIREESEGESEGAGVVGGPEDAEGPEISGGLENIGGLKDTGAPENIGFGVPDTSTGNLLIVSTLISCQSNFMSPSPG